MDNFRRTLLPTFDIKAGYNLVNGGAFTPFLFLGLHGYGFKDKINTPAYTSDTYYDGGIFGGGGFEYVLNDQWAFQATGDYRYIVTADADPKPKYWVAKAGLSYSLKPREEMDREEIEYPLYEGEIS